EALRAALREAVATGRRGDREDVREARAEAIVRADVDVQAQAGKHAARRLGLEQARREAARTSDEHAGDPQEVADADAQERAEVGERTEQRRQQPRLDARVKAGDLAKGVRVARAAERRGVDRIA